MTRSVTMFTGLLLLVLMALPAQAQTQVTIREINAIPQTQVDGLNDLGAAITENIDATTGVGINDPQEGGTGLIFNDLLQQEVQFTAVVIGDPRNSGLSTPDGTTGNPSRVHMYLRDVAAATEGNEGMTIQIVDASWQENGITSLFIGDVIEVVGLFDPFASQMQVAPTSITLLGVYNDGTFNLPDSILDPVTIGGTGDVNMNVGDGVVLPNWNNLSDLRNQFVRIENAKVIDRDVSSDRPNFTISSDEGETFINFYDISLQYRNDRDGSYNGDIFNVKDEDFVPPPIGALINIEGYLVMPSDDPFSRSAAANGDDIIVSLVPWDAGAIEVTQSPPSIAAVPVPDAVPSTDPVTLSFDVVPDASRTVTRVDLKYTTSSDDTEQTVAATNVGGNTYEAILPAAPDGDFVTYFVEAEDSEGAVTASSTASTRFLVGGIDSIEDIQLTVDGGPGNSPFTGVTTDMDLTVVVMSDPARSGEIALQDDAGLSPWSGILIDPTSELTAAIAMGDQLHITNATIEEEFDVTQLDNVTYENLGQVALYDHLVVTTDVLQDESIAEAHEGMRLRFENVTILNSDSDGSFGEISFASDGDDVGVEADDKSDDISDDWGNMLFADGDRVDFIQGFWWFSFGEYKLVPENLAADIGTVTDIEDEALPGSFALHQNFPNPFNPTTSIRYDAAVPGRVTLEVFDLTGRKVATLVDGPVAAGAHEASFNARGLASGIYLYRLTAGSQVTMKKMVLLK